MLAYQSSSFPYSSSFRWVTPKAAIYTGSLSSHTGLRWTAHNSYLLDNITFLVSTCFTISLPSSLLILSGIISQIKLLHWNPYLRPASEINQTEMGSFIFSSLYLSFLNWVKKKKKVKNNGIWNRSCKDDQ